MKSLFIVLLLLINFNLQSGETSPIFKVDYLESVRHDFSPEALKIALEKYVLFPDIVYAQARLETGNFTSTIFIYQSNVFGMRHPKIRQTLSIGSANHFAVYPDWLSSVEDYAMWQRYYINKGYDTLSYDKFLKVYCPDKNYSKKVNQLLKEQS